MAQPQPLTPFGSALAGALGGIFSNALVYPLDTAKVRLQAHSAAEISALFGEDPSKPKQRGLVAVLKRYLKKWKLLAMLIRILRQEGLSGAFKGFSANMINTFSMQFAYFFFHSLLRNNALKTAVGGLSTGAELGLGAAAGALAQIFTIPVAVIATRQQLWEAPPGATGKAAHEPTLMETAREIIKDGGVTALWTGLKPGLVLTVNPAITYGVFERGKAWILGPEGGKLSVGQSFWLGVASKTLATVVTYPYIFAKVRLQAGPEEDRHEELKHVHEGETYADAVKKGHSRPRGAIELLTQVYKEDGFAGWYQGMSAQIVKAVLCQGILFVCKDQFEDQARAILNLGAKLKEKHPLLASKV